MQARVSNADPRDLGFSLLEVLVAMVLLATATIGLGELFVIASAATRGARTQTWASILAADKMEQLRALAWGYASDGSAITDTSTDLSVQPPTNAGTGLLASPADSLERNISGYVDYLDAGGRWVGSGSTPPSQAVYIRRWGIEPLPASPADTVLFRVLVTTVSREHAAETMTGGPRRRLPDDALVAGIKTRKGQ